MLRDHKCGTGIPNNARGAEGSATHDLRLMKPAFSDNESLEPKEGTGEGGIKVGSQ